MVCSTGLFLLPGSLYAQRKDSTRTRYLDEVEIIKQKKRDFAVRKLRDVEETRIFAGKKNEVILMDLKLGALALNNSRNIFSQVAGINAFDNNDGGLQLNIGGRGLNPNRTSNFNTRQNNYDISADVLGYPESYYSPPSEAIEEIQVIRGAASLQYGTQFGGLINFKLKKPQRNKKLEILARATAASFNTHTTFVSASGKTGGTEYYSFFNYKEGNGPQENSDYNARNFFLKIGQKISPKTTISAEITRFNYLAHQPGGLTDKMFYEDAYQSHRARNWFKVNWNLYSASLSHTFSDRLKADLMVFGLDASRYTVGFRPTRVAEPDYTGAQRDLITGTFRNAGAEGKLLYRYGKRQNALLIGGKYYQAKNKSRQGAGMQGSGPDFNFDENNSTYFYQSSYTYPNQNIAFFAENIFYLTDKWSVIPGVRWEKIRTGAKGSYKRIIEDNAGNILLNKTTEEDETNDRSFVLFGLGTSYKFRKGLELYGNISQNYRSVTFSDIRVENNSQVVDPNIKDETGFTADAGFRGNWKDYLTWDLNIFSLYYDNKIDNVFRKRENVYADVIRTRTNVGTAWMRGAETFLEVNLAAVTGMEKKRWLWNGFVNFAYTKANYIKSEIPGIEGNTVEYVPELNLRTGLTFGYKNFVAGILYSKMSKQYSSANNEEQNKQENTWGVRGAIPAYAIWDLNMGYTLRENIKLEAGINNLLDTRYFTRRATGYPGPGIIPSAPREYYVTVQMKF